jgi:hypothetical protein
LSGHAIRWYPVLALLCFGSMLGAATLGSIPSSWISSIVSRHPSQSYPRAHKLPSIHMTAPPPPLHPQPFYDASISTTITLHINSLSIPSIIPLLIIPPAQFPPVWYQGSLTIPLAHPQLSPGVPEPFNRNGMIQLDNEFCSDIKLRSPTLHSRLGSVMFPYESFLWVICI